jgi:hypothetical protein
MAAKLRLSKEKTKQKVDFFGFHVHWKKEKVRFPRNRTRTFGVLVSMSLKVV